MTLRFKLSLVLSLVVLGLVTLIALASRRMLIYSSLQVEQRLIRTNVERAMDAIRAEQSTLDVIAIDWSAWDDTYAFIEDGNEEYRSANLSDQTLQDLKLHWMAIVSSNGFVMYGRSMDLAAGTGGALSPEVQTWLSPGAVLVSHTSVTDCVSGLVGSDRSLFVVSSRPITTTDKKGAVRGSMLIARRLDWDALERLGAATHTKLDILPLSMCPEAPEDPREALVLPLDRTQVRGVVKLAGLQGKPMAILVVTTEREVYRQGIIGARSVVGWLLLTGLLFTVMTLFLLNRLVLASISSSTTMLRDGVRRVTSDANLSSRVETAARDDLQDLTHSINEMLVALEDSQARSARSEKELERAHKLAALGTLLSGVAHEINNPNSVVMLNAVALKQFWPHLRPLLDELEQAQGGLRLGNRKYAEVRDEIPALLDEIEKAAHRIGALVDELKRFGRPDRATMAEIVDVNAAVESAVTLLHHEMAQRSVPFEERLTERLPPVKGNRQRLERVVVNLLQNAFQAITEKAQAVRVETAASTDGSQVIIRVVDEGCGIPAENLAKVTDPFFTTRRGVGGTGLGLSISAEIIREHGGNLEVQSAEGKGTTVTLTLPVAKENAT